jgi:YhcG PDDEXK nuclease domain/DUF1016 N-terminal domain
VESKVPALPAGYVDVRSGIAELLYAARRAGARSVNALMTANYWAIGRRIVQAEQKGKRRAGYGEQLIARLSLDLTQQFWRGFSRQNLQRIRFLAQAFTLPWSAYVQVVMLTKGAVAKPEDAISPDEAVKDLYVLEFLNLKDEYSESQLEEALIHRLEDFLLELGSDFAFVGRQRRLRIDQTWYRVDLLLFHRRLRCLVIIDLKLSSLTHADVGQMYMCCNYVKENWTLEGENPPVGLILCADKGHALAWYALDGLPNKIMAASYKTVLPDTEVLQKELERSRLMLESRGVAGKKWNSQ